MTVPTMFNQHRKSDGWAYGGDTDNLHTKHKHGALPYWGRRPCELALCLQISPFIKEGQGTRRRQL